MTACSDLADYEWLTGSEASSVLLDLAEDKTPLHTVAARLRGRFSSTQTHLLLEQAELRRRATTKFTQSHQMLFTRVGLEQATDEWVARYKAERFRQRTAKLNSTEAEPPIADLCCGIGGDLQALRCVGPVFGVDRDPITALFAAVNTGSRIHSTEITDLDFSEATAFHLDPDRRPGGRRTTSLEFCEPNLATIKSLLTHVPNAAIKLAPATNVPTNWNKVCELEWISRDRECRQLVAWHGNLALAPGRHRATILSTPYAPTNTFSSRTVVGEPKQQPPLTHSPGRFIFDIDPAVLAGKLKGALAVEHDLSALSAGPTYLTGDNAIADPALACFEIIDVLPFRMNKLTSYLRSRNIGQLEIKKRGVDLNPETVRRQLKLQGTSGSTLLITPIAGKPTAIIACRVDPPPTR